MNGTFAFGKGEGMPRRFRVASGKAIEVGIERAVTSRWERVLERAATVEGATIDERVSSVIKSYSRELATLGAAAGGVAAAPAVGTTASLTTAMSEFTWFTVRVAEMILTIGALHGHTRASVDERRTWVTTILAFGNDAADEVASIGIGSKALPAAAVARLNETIGCRLVSRYGTRRGVVALGQALPFGIGMAIGGSANYGAVRLIGRHAHRFFSTLRGERVIDADSRDTDRIG